MVSEASQAPAAFAAGFAFVGTVGWSRVRHLIGRSRDEAPGSGDDHAAHGDDDDLVSDDVDGTDPAEASAPAVDATVLEPAAAPR